jgi:nucleoside phosphorylase
MTETPRPVMTDLCLVSAVDVEFKAATSLLNPQTFSDEFQIKTCRGDVTGVSGQRRVTVLQCGMGAPAFAHRLAEHLRRHRYDALIIAGLAGGLDPALKAGDAVIYDICLDWVSTASYTQGSKEKPLRRDQNASIRCDDQLSGLLFGLLQGAARRTFRGRGVTVDRILTEAQDKISLGVRAHAAAADMESYGVLDVCADLGVPAAVLRIISDEAQADLPDFNRAAEADGRMNAWRTAAVMAARPVASLKFLAGIRPVLRALGENLKVVLHA